MRRLFCFMRRWFGADHLWYANPDGIWCHDCGKQLR